MMKDEDIVFIQPCDFCLPPLGVRVQRGGKSAPAAARGAGSVNPGWEQGQRNDGWSFTSSVQ